jgi:hypothetical protein
MDIIAALMLIIAVVSFFILLIMLFAPRVILDLSDGAAPPSRKSVLKVGVPVVVSSLVLALLMLPHSFFNQGADIKQTELALTVSHPSHVAKQAIEQKAVNNLTDADLEQMLEQAQDVIAQHQSHLSAKQ